uniref:Uncharacterized protein n=1 Tax=Physcomitrium patens TaxID=3218 RepID=A0A2K1JYP0_PHYPA|nr:hypothetical protein PHYPA_013763 [Physcomitrium patens]
MENGAERGIDVGAFVSRKQVHFRVGILHSVELACN